jgi:hypothetical protein
MLFGFYPSAQNHFLLIEENLKGFHISSTHPLQGIGTNLEYVADRLDEIAKALAYIVEGISTLHTQMPNTRQTLIECAADVDNCGNDLLAAGSALQDAGNLLKIV